MVKSILLIFSSKILSESLQASVLLPTPLCGVIAMDVDKLNKEIISALDTDKAVQSYLADITNTQYARWSKDLLGSSGLMRGFMSLCLAISISVFSIPITIIQSLDTLALTRLWH